MKQPREATSVPLAPSRSNSGDGWQNRVRDCGVAWSILRGSGLRDASPNLASPIRNPFGTDPEFAPDSGG